KVDQTPWGRGAPIAEGGSGGRDGDSQLPHRQILATHFRASNLVRQNSWNLFCTVRYSDVRSCPGLLYAAGAAATWETARRRRDSPAGRSRSACGRPAVITQKGGRKRSACKLLTVLGDDAHHLRNHSERRRLVRYSAAAPIETSATPRIRMVPNQVPVRARCPSGRRSSATA